MIRFVFKFILIGFCLAGCQQKEDTSSDLFPLIEPFEEGFLQVSDLHQIHYELSGNPDGKPVFVLHGGPGGSCRPFMRRFFNPEKYLIVMHDQRGAGQSRPYGTLEENTTWDLVSDIEKLRKRLKLDKIMLFGGSWGSTLALAYAETYPGCVTGMIIRGVFTGTQDEINHFYHGGSRLFYPEEYDKLEAVIPDSGRKQRPQKFVDILTSEDTSVYDYYSDAWMYYEWVISDLEVNRQEVKQWVDENYPYAFSLIENYYMAHGCFLEEGQLLNQADRIAHIPAIIINGRFDMPCPPVTAYEIHKALPLSELVIVEKEGHWGPGIERELVKAAERLEDK